MTNTHLRAAAQTASTRAKRGKVASKLKKGKSKPNKKGKAREFSGSEDGEDVYESDFVVADDEDIAEEPWSPKVLRKLVRRGSLQLEDDNA